MAAKDKQQQAADLLKLFKGDLEATLAAVRLADSKSKQKKSKKSFVAKDAPVIIDIKNITKQYKLGRQKVEALKGVSLKVQAGEFVALTGPSGSGKSTLLQLIGGLDRPSDGLVTVNNKNISKLSDRQLSIFRNQTIGFVFQFFYLQPFLKLQTNIEVPAMFARTKSKLRSPRAVELADAVGLTDRVKHLPKELSGGQMQRAAIARALQNEPKIILADEPTGNLDSVNSKAIIDLFEQVREQFGATIVVVTHDPAVAARADREIKLVDGVVA